MIVSLNVLVFGKYSNHWIKENLNGSTFFSVIIENRPYEISIAQSSEKNDLYRNFNCIVLSDIRNLDYDIYEIVRKKKFIYAAMPTHTRHFSARPLNGLYQVIHEIFPKCFGSIEICEITPEDDTTLGTCSERNDALPQELDVFAGQESSDFWRGDI